MIDNNVQMPGFTNTPEPTLEEFIAPKPMTEGRAREMAYAIIGEASYTSIEWKKNWLLGQIPSSVESDIHPFDLIPSLVQEELVEFMTRRIVASVIFKKDSEEDARQEGRRAMTLFLRVWLDSQPYVDRVNRERISQWLSESGLSLTGLADDPAGEMFGSFTKP